MTPEGRFRKLSTMPSFDGDNLNLGEEQVIVDASEFLEPFKRNFQEQMISLSDVYTESVVNLFQQCSFNGTHHHYQESNHGGDETDKAMQQLLLSALKLSQALMAKFIQQVQKK